MNRPPDLVVIDGALSDDIIAAAAQSIRDMLAISPEDFDVYSHPFEPKLQLKKQFHSVGPMATILQTMRSIEFAGFMAKIFGLPGLVASSDYYAGFYVYRPGDYLQNHIDSTTHDNERKVVTANLYLSDCAGGALAVGDRTIHPRTNRIVAFVNNDRSCHSVGRVISGNRIMLTAGYCLPADQFPLEGFTRTNRRALFMPGPGETWTEDQYRMRDERADPNRRPA